MEFPLITFGTFQIRGKKNVKDSLDIALKSGYRSIDTARVYKNEIDIGEVLQEWFQEDRIKRSDLFLTSKLGPNDHGFTKSRAALMTSLENLRLDYIDMYLIHWPGVQGMKLNDTEMLRLRTESWIELEKLYHEGKIKNLGVSNYTISHLKELLSVCSIKPQLLQIEYHPHLVQRELKEFCEENGIFLQAYSPLGSSTAANELLSDQTIVEISTELNKSSAQILLRWAIQQGIGIIPKSCKEDRIKENIDIFNFHLTERQIELISSLNKNKHYCWDPNTIL